jgi:hypothetical protein
MEKIHNSRPYTLAIATILSSIAALLQAAGGYIPGVGMLISPFATVADKLTFPASITFDDHGEVYIGETGYSYGPAAAEARIVHIQKDGNKKVIAANFDDRPLTGLSWHNGYFYAITGGFNGKVFRVSRSGEKEVLIRGLRGGADHYTSDIVIGPDEKMYFGVGTVTNTSVVGKDNYLMGWLGRNKGYHDIPARDIKLKGRNYETPNFLTKTKPNDKVKTGLKGNYTERITEWTSGEAGWLKTTGIRFMRLNLVGLVGLILLVVCR